MEHKPVGAAKSGGMFLQVSHRLSRRVIIIASVLVIAAAGGVYVLISQLRDRTTKANSSAEKVLTVDDLNNPEVVINSQVSDASVNSIAQELQSKIDQQIAAQQNPFDSVYEMAAMLSSTTNKSRPEQMTVFVEGFLAKHEDSLRFGLDSETPDQADVNNMKARLYALLVYNYQFIMVNKFTDSQGQAIDTTKEQLKYVNLYLALAHDPASRSRATDQYKQAQLAYDYADTQNFLILQKQLGGGN